MYKNNLEKCMVLCIILYYRFMDEYRYVFEGWCMFINIRYKFVLVKEYFFLLNNFIYII